MERVGTGRTAELCLPISPVVTVTCGFHRIQPPPERFAGLECSADIGEDSQAFPFSRMTTHPPLKLWPFPMYAAFPRSEYYGQADSLWTHRRFSRLFPTHDFRSPSHRSQGLPSS